MKGDTVLDYVELQLTPPRTRCELFVAAGGVTEKLASGFLKPFLTHLRAVEEQVARGCNSVRLEHPRSLKEYHGRSWFTKGTLERFVRFVSTPEVLERVKSVEDELAQLEQVRSIQASTLLQAEDTFVDSDSAPSKSADGQIHFGVLEKKGSSSKLPRRYQYDAVNSEAEASKVELLRAMDLRLLALQQEQTTAFGRAAAAGFSSENMADLIGFSEHFGAERLHKACINFLAILKTRHAESTHVDSEAGSSGSGMLLCNVRGLNQGSQVDMLEGSHYSHEERTDMSDVTSSNKGTDLSSRGSGGTEVRKRWGPPENIRTQLYVDQTEIDSASSNDTSNGVSVNGSPEVQSLIKKTPIASIEQGVPHTDNLFGILATDANISVSSARGKDAANVVSAGNTDPSLMHSLEAQADCNGSASPRSLSLEKRSLSLPFRKTQTESPLPGHTSFPSQEPSIKDKGWAMELSSKNSEGQKNGGDVVDSETLSPPIVAPARRLSVQDAISLFENKQRRDSTDSSGKHRSGKQESGRLSLEGAGTSSSGSMTFKRRDSGKGPEAGIDLPENQVSCKPEAGVLGNECPIGASAASSLVGSTSLCSSHSSLGRQGDSLAPPVAGGLIKSLSNAKCQPSVPSVSAKVEAAASGKQIVHQHEQISSDSVREAAEVDWRKQFKLQLEKSLGKDLFTRDLPVKDDLQKIESGTRNKEAVEKGGVSVESRQSLPIQGTAGLKTLPVAYGEDTKGQNGQDKSGLCLSGFKKTETMDIKEESGRNEVAKLLVMSDNATNHSSGRESLGSSSVNPLGHNMQAVATSADNQTIEDDMDPSGLKGRFYEHYRKLRDAKLMEDQDSKRAEREAKLKVMEETLTRRKAEMDARAVRLSKNSFNQIRATKVEASKADLHTPRKDQHDGGSEGNKSVGKDQMKSISGPTSPPLTPYTGKEVPSTSKPQGGRKAGAVVVVSQKGATPPRSSSRPTPSVSPKVTPRSTTIAAGSLRKTSASGTTDNPLTRSVPCFANLRKENTKPSPGRPLGSARVHPKNGVPGRTRGVNEAAPLEANVNVPARTNFSRNGPTKEDQKHRSALMRKSCATASDFKSLSTSCDDGVLAPLKGQREMKTEPAAYNKLRRSAIGPLQEAKPFLRKGRGIGPGTGPGMIKQKNSSGLDAAKSSDEEITTSQLPEPDNGDGASQVLDESFSRELSEVENMDIEDDAPVDFGSINHMEVQAIDTVNSLYEEDRETTAMDTCPVEPSPDYLHDTERACHTISFPIDIETHNQYAVEFGTETDSNLMFDPDALSLKEEDIEALSQHDEQTTESFQNQPDEGLASTSFHASSLPHEHNLPVFSPVPPSPLSSGLDQYDQLSLPAVVKLESPLGSPASWNSSQLQYTDVTQCNKKWIAYQRPVMASQPKEPVRGFKRLLKFGRKSRASEIATADCISASTTSEGDDELEEQSRYFADEVSSRGRLQERRYNDVLGEHHKVEEEGPAQNVRSSIPTPPANFRLRDDHLSGGTMLKAPRSFFSLSSFRSKGSEGKSR
eukprot:c17345_g1_i1 orf=327-4910(-)